ncbi:MAG: NAD-dependent epimerase/dehydratase family protein, partial [Candidatus Lokiarchaeota archaeon]|nr:NAD-dependent epimerase/dehydratase family protein [Candidatus Lokiarchaeota archaeon]
MKKVLVTGSAGFIGARVSEMLLEEGYQVVGLDDLNDYYDVNLKFWRLEKLKKHSNFIFFKFSIENYHELKTIFQENCPEGVINLAARTGVRYSLENPFIYLSTNSGGNLNLLELCREYGVSKFVLASTSSLYAGQKMPFKESLPVNTPISPYAASKKAAEMMAYSYHYLYGLDITILRYFTVYGPSGRPDMATFRFIKWIMESGPLEIFGDGNQKRDFTYIDDIARGTIRALKPLRYEIINLGNNYPYKLSEVIELMEKSIGKKAHFDYKEFHQADMQ